MYHLETCYLFIKLISMNNVAEKKITTYSLFKRVSSQNINAY